MTVQLSVTNGHSSETSKVETESESDRPRKVEVERQNDSDGVQKTALKDEVNQVHVALHMRSHHTPEKKDSSLLEDKKFKPTGLADTPQAEVSKKKSGSEADASSDTKKNEDEYDPLDVFMAQIDGEVNKLKQESIDKARIEMISSSLNDASSASNKNAQVDTDLEEEEETFDEAQDNDDIQKLTKISTKKMLEPVDHSKINYAEFRKAFYVEVPEIASMTNEEVQLYQEQLEGIRIRGRACPRPIKTFAQAGLATKLLDRLKKFKYEKPTPIQAQALPAIMSGRDVIGIAKTGSGKTLAFLLPMFRHILDQPDLQPGDGPIGLIIAPTRELATQINTDIREFQSATGITSCCAYGGAGIGQQISDLKRGVHVVVCTPGRMIELLCTNKGRVTNLHRVTYLVLDEADRMFDLGFEQQILRIVNNIRPDRQTVVFSATFPRQVEVAARRILTNPLEITVYGRNTVSNTIEQIIEVREHSAKFRRLMDLISDWYDKGSILIFADRQESVDALFHNLIKSGYNCMSFHSGKEQMDRDEAIQAFKNGTIKILIATSAASRGLDVPNLRLVINYDVPNHLEDYVHRVGRTGRAGKPGTAVTFIDPVAEEQYAGDLVRALKDANNPIPPELDQLAKNFEEKMKKGLAKRHRSGFDTGKGFSFTEEEDKLRKAAQYTSQKHFASELAEDLVDTDNEEEGEDEDGVKMTTKKEEDKKRFSSPGQAMPGGVGSGGHKASYGSGQGHASSGQAYGGTAEAENMMPGLRAASAKVKQLLASKSALGSLEADGQRFSKPIEVHYDTEIDINDFPQNVRWKVTHKDALADIIEFTGCAITAKGIFVEPGKPVPPNERKLYLSIEGPTQEDVNNARAEIKRILEESMSSVAMRGERPIGRYSVLEN
ncbi:uncharacterized protein LOC126325473 [Schistocerca gregaria]|uniref:uncharacterized protein LOC126325473 n=1 Tax=Schistocerca gregaria TaxID=7010 RepID=UPI00211E7BD8|nr:uncharacterized protein LOC126325473 [Schistocerca gregaria]